MDAVCSGELVIDARRLATAALWARTRWPAGVVGLWYWGFLTTLNGLSMLGDELLLVSDEEL